MTNAELVAAIAANPTAAALAASGNDVACAAAITATLPPVSVSTLIDQRSLCSAFTAPSLNPSDVPTLLSVLSTLATAGFPAASPAPIPANPLAGLVLAWLAPSEGGVDVTNALVIEVLTLLNTSTIDGVPLLSSEIADTIVALGQRPATITHGQVSAALLSSRAGNIIGA
jgi:hypothetical protein